MFKNTSIQQITDYFLVIILIAVSGIPYFGYTFYWIVGLIIVLYVAFGRDSVFLLKNRMFLVYSFLFSLIILFQAMHFSIFSTSTLIGFLIKTALSFLIIKLLDHKFLSYFVNCIIVIACISFVFWIPNLIIGEGFEKYFATELAPLFRSPFYDPSSFYQEGNTIIIYCFNSFGPGVVIARNSGPFWEPGAFAGMLILAVLFELIQSGGRLNYRFIILSIALLSTSSTTGYVGLGFILLGLVIIRNPWYVSVIIVPLVLLLFTVLFTQIPFLQNKIQHQLSIGVNQQYVGSRFVNAKRDFEDFKKFPVFGRGQNPLTRYDTNISELMHKNNGVTDFLVKWGLVGFSLYFVLLFAAFRRLCWNYDFNWLFAYVALFTIGIIGFSETWFSKPLFVGLVFLSEINKLKFKKE